MVMPLACPSDIPLTKGEALRLASTLGHIHPFSVLSKFGTALSFYDRFEKKSVPLAFRCKEDICHGVGSLLVFVKNLKGLAAIRDAIWDLLSAESISQHWDTVCQRLLERRLPIWDDFLQQLFLQRLQVSIHKNKSILS